MCMCLPLHDEASVTDKDISYVTSKITLGVKHLCYQFQAIDDEF